MGTTITLAPADFANDGGITQAKKSLASAIADLQSMHDCGTLEYPAKILLRGGRYHISKALEISTTFPLIIEGAEGEEAVIDGGRELADWHEVNINGCKAWQATADIPVEMLFFRGKALRPASFPKGDALYRVRDIPAPTAFYQVGVDHFQPEDGSFNKDWYNIQGISCHFYHWWVEEHLPVESYDAEKDEITSSYTSRYIMNHENTEYRFENVREALTEPGEFYYDSLTKTVTVITGEELESTTERPLCSSLGGLIYVNNARMLTFKNLSFQYAGAYMPACTAEYDISGLKVTNYQMKKAWANDSGLKPWSTAGQGATQVPGVIIYAHSTDCDMTGCTISACGWYGVDVTAGCSNIRITRNHIFEMGAGGVRIGGAKSIDEPTELTSRIIVKNNHIHDCGFIFESSIGVLITHAYGNLVEHNHIHDMFYSGISVGWVWGYTDSVTRENRIGWNLIHDLGKEVLSDMGGIYLLGIQPGTRVYNNFIYNVKRRYYGGWGIYTDEGSSHIVVENNICTDCSSDAYHQHYGRENTLRYNIFAFGGDSCLCMSRGDEQMNVYPGRNFSNALSSYNNVFVTDGKPFVTSGKLENLVVPIYISENSVFYNVGEGDFPPAGKARWEEGALSVEEWKERGFDRGLICADPGFNDLAKRDFTFGPDSLLAKLHFPMLDISKVGIEE